MIRENIATRERYNKVVAENGLKHVWISNKINIANSTMSNWKIGTFDLGKDKLGIVSDFLKRYE